MKIVHAAKFYAPVTGGMETVVQDLCDGTAMDWDVRVVAASESPTTTRERVGSVSVFRAGALGRAHSVPICPGLPMELWRSRADCVVLHEPNPIAGTALFLRTPSPRLVIWHHADLVRPAWAPGTYGRIQAALYRRADCVIVSSPTLAAGSALVRNARRVAVIPFGIELDRYRRDDAATRAAVDRLRRSTAGPRVLFVGRLVYYKGVQVLIDAMAACAGTLILAGDGPLEPELRARAAATGVADRVVFLGRVSDGELPALYRSADLFVLPSIARTEAFGVVQLEAMAAGLPVISTNLPTGVPWVNQDQVTGLTVPPGDADALAAAMGRVLGDARLRERFARNASIRVTSLFTRDRMVSRFREIIEQVVRGPEALARGLRRAEAS
jgi:rhamnosyl/mannosyltransferase